MGIPRMLSAAALVVVVGLTATGCWGLIFPEDSRAFDVTELGECTTEPPEWLPDSGSDYVPPIDHPMMYAEVEVTNVESGVREYSVHVDVFTKDGEKVGRMSGHIEETEPGEVGNGLLIGDMNIAMPPEGVDCVLEEVHVELG